MCSCDQSVPAEHRRAGHRRVQPPNRVYGAARAAELHGAVCLQPLTVEQIDGYLEGGGRRLAALREVIRKDPPLQELARSPLMLNVISLAYQDLPAETIADQSSNSAESRRMHLFEPT